MKKPIIYESNVSAFNTHVLGVCYKVAPDMLRQDEVRTILPNATADSVTCPLCRDRLNFGTINEKYMEEPGVYPCVAIRHHSHDGSPLRSQVLMSERAFDRYVGKNTTSIREGRITFYTLTEKNQLKCRKEQVMVPKEKFVLG